MYEFEAYLGCPNRRLRRAYARFRVSDHNLAVERGRWATVAQQGEAKRPIPLCDRLCLACNDGSVQDEWHIFRCAAYAHWRVRYAITCTSREDICQVLRLATPATMWYVYRVMRDTDDRVRGAQPHIVGTDHPGACLS